LHHFQDITTFAVYVTDCGLEKSLNFEKTVELTGHVCFLICLQTQDINTCCNPDVRMRVRKVSSSKSDLQGHWCMIGAIW